MVHFDAMSYMYVGGFLFILLHMTNIYLSKFIWYSMHLALSKFTHSSYLRRNVVFINFLNLFFDISSGHSKPIYSKWLTFDSGVTCVHI